MWIVSNISLSHAQKAEEVLDKLKGDQLLKT